MEQNKKVCFKSDGTVETGKRIIKALKELGCDTGDYKATDGSHYYFMQNGALTILEHIPQGYELKELPNEIEALSNKPLREKDMIEGEVYLITYKDTSYLVEKSGKYIYIEGKRFSQDLSFFYHSGDIIELASEENKKWFQTCIKAGKYLSKEDALKEKEIMFKEGDYIVVLRPESENTSYIKYNYCYRQLRDSQFLYVEKGNDGHPCNSNIKQWRYATSEEAAHYEKIGKPYDVTTLQKDVVKETGIFPIDHSKESIIEEAKKKYSIGSTFLDLVHNKEFIVASHDFYNTAEPSQLYIPVKANSLGNKTARIYKNGKWAKLTNQPSTKEAYDKQFSTSESNLEKAKRLYPKGTKFKSLYWSSNINTSSGEFVSNSKNTIITDINNKDVYREGFGINGWAEIIEEAPKIMTLSDRFEIHNTIATDSYYPIIPSNAYVAPVELIIKSKSKLLDTKVDSHESTKINILNKNKYEQSKIIH